MENAVHSKDTIEFARKLATIRAERFITLRIDVTYAGYAWSPDDPNVAMYYVHDSRTGECIGDITYDYGVWAFCTPDSAPCYAACVSSYEDAVLALCMFAYLSDFSYDNAGA